jgi:hypothetical protein
MGKNTIKELIKVPVPGNVEIINTVKGYDYFYAKNLGSYPASPLQATCLINHNWPFHMDAVSKASFAKNLLRTNIYTVNLELLGTRIFCKNFSDFLDANILTYFYHLTEEGIQPSLYDKNLVADMVRQGRPDLLLNFLKSKYKSLQRFEHKILSLDMKTSVNLSQPENKILNNTIFSYRKAIGTYIKQFSARNNNVDLIQLNKWGARLSDSADFTSEEGFYTHVETWKSGLSILGYGDFLPPIRVPMSFNTYKLTHEAHVEYLSGFENYTKITLEYFK